MMNQQMKHQKKKGFDPYKIIENTKVAFAKKRTFLKAGYFNSTNKLSHDETLISTISENYQTATFNKGIITQFFINLLKNAFKDNIFFPGQVYTYRILGLSLSLTLIMILSGCNQKTEEVYPKYGDSPAFQRIPVYHFAIIALHNPAKLIQEYQPLIDYLNKKIAGVRFVLEPSINYANFEKKYKDRTPEFLLPNPWQTLQAMKSGYNVIAIAGDPKDFKGIFIVRHDSGINKPSDLIGKAVSYPSPTALAACIMPQYFLHTHGVNINRDIKNQYVGSQESSIMNVYLKMTSAGTTWPPSWRSFQKEHPKEASELKVIWETEPLVNISVMARNDIPANIKEQVRKYLLELNETMQGKKILQGTETSHFIAATDKDYDVVRIYIERFEKEIRKVETK
jgi:phosphonate transport system substrate-binding protein